MNQIKNVHIPSWDWTLGTKNQHTYHQLTSWNTVRKHNLAINFNLEALHCPLHPPNKEILPNDTVLKKKLCYVVVFTTILQFRPLINYVGVCKLYTNILNINVYLDKSCFIFSFHFQFCKRTIVMWNHFARSVKNFFRVCFGHIFQVFFALFFNTLYPKFLDKTLRFCMDVRMDCPNKLYKINFVVG